MPTETVVAVGLLGQTAEVGGEFLERQVMSDGDGCRPANWLPLRKALPGNKCFRRKVNGNFSCSSLKL